jgi:DNA polymerase III alpha subunit
MAARKMIINGIGEVGYTQAELAGMLRSDPDKSLDCVQLVDAQTYNHAIQEMYSDFRTVKAWIDLPYDADYHAALQSQWHIPQQYATVDIAQLVLDRCENQDELQRVGQELMMFQDYGLFPLLKFLHYLVQTLSDQGIVMGVGRGSSVASFVLYKLGVHRVNSLYYDLDINEFLK